RVASCGAGAVVTKSIGVSPNHGYPGPVSVQTECGFLNAMGLPNPSYKEFASELQEAKGDVPVIVSIFGRDADEFVEVARGLGGADAFELNVSCPHAKGYGSEIGSDPGLVEKITESMKESADVPVWVKLTPNVTDIVKIGVAAQSGGADAVVAINTVRGMAIDIDSGHPILSNRFGGLSGPGIKPIALKCVYDLYAALDIPIIGVGGISSPEDALEFMMAGANAVQIGSAVYNKIEIFKEVADGMMGYLEGKGYSLQDIIGLAHEV
ncbi:MAG: dihydroorotate dehydrogenase, partial [Halobacteriota archaeon]|nr:dihydroorotate dehydrogenase [Halobacteriota archaeon]